MASEKVLTRWDWSTFVGENNFEQIVLSLVGAGLSLFLVQSDQVSLPPWLMPDLGLSVFCVGVAFLRVWKTVREENESDPLWAGIERSSSAYDHAVDLVFEVPYVLVLIALPFAAVGPVAFIATMGLFYVVDNYYNAALIVGSALAPPPGVHDLAPPPPDRRTALRAWVYCRSLFKAFVSTFFMLRVPKTRYYSNEGVKRFFVTRYRLNQVLIVLVIGTLIAIKDSAPSDSAMRDLWFCAIAIAVIELLIEPFRTIGAPFGSHERDADGVA